MLCDNCFHRKVCRCIAGKRCPYFIDGAKCAVIPKDFLGDLLDTCAQFCADNKIKAIQTLTAARDTLTDYIDKLEDKR